MQRSDRPWWRPRNPRFPRIGQQLENFLIGCLLVAMFCGCGTCALTGQPNYDLIDEKGRHYRMIDGFRVYDIGGTEFVQSPNGSLVRRSQ